MYIYNNIKLYKQGLKTGISKKIEKNSKKVLQKKIDVVLYSSLEQTDRNENKKVSKS